MEFLTEAEAIEFIGETLGVSITRWSLIDYRRKRTGPAYHKVAGRVLYKRKDIMAWIDAGRVTTNEAING